MFNPPARFAPLTAALAIVVVVATVLGLSITPVSGAGADVARREAALRRATAARVQAQDRVARVEAELASVQAELDRLGAADEVLTEELATARRELREYAIAAYIDGGQTEIFLSSLSPEKAAALAWQSTMALGQSISADGAAGRFEDLKEATTPARLEAAARLDQVNTQLEEARADAIQAAAHERDAESALAAARAAAAEAKAEADRAARRAAEREAAQQARAKADQRLARSRATSSPVEPAAASAVAVEARASGARGNPTSAESSTLARIRRCESGGRYGAVSSSGRYRGAYQFDRATWASVGGSGDPAAASPAEQDYRALMLLRQRGTRPWPVCGR